MDLLSVHSIHNNQSAPATDMIYSCLQYQTYYNNKHNNQSRIFPLQSNGDIEW